MKHRIDREMSVTVEFFGIPRERAGTAKTMVTASTLGSALLELGRSYPRFAESCLHSGELAKGYVVNLNGERFVTDIDTPLRSGDAILILSADAGG
jgi:molybdopterin converting factor small subunit